MKFIHDAREVVATNNCGECAHRDICLKRREYLEVAGEIEEMLSAEFSTALKIEFYQFDAEHGNCKDKEEAKEILKGEEDKEMMPIGYEVRLICNYWRKRND